MITLSAAQKIECRLAGSVFLVEAQTLARIEMYLLCK